MKNIIFISLIIFLFGSCDIFKSKEKIAIELCQTSKVQSPNIFDLEDNSTWLDFANMIAKESPNLAFSWKAIKTNENNLYVVSFVDTSLWGFRWEVDVNQKIVKSINQNEYLRRKYGLSGYGGDKEFKITKIEQKGLEFKFNYYDSKPEIIYIFKAFVLNKTDKVIYKANLSGSLRLIFKEKTVSANEDYSSGFNSSISQNNPWMPNTIKQFYIKTQGIDNIYSNYDPDYIFFVASLFASDPVGYEFNRDIADINLRDEWKLFKEAAKKGFNDKNVKADGFREEKEFVDSAAMVDFSSDDN